MTNKEITLHLRNWNAWAPGLTTLTAWEEWAKTGAKISGSNLPELKSVSALVRRRLSKSGRTAFEVAINCTPKEMLEKVELVFASRHGESETTERLLATT